MSKVGELSVVITADADGVKKAITASNAALRKGSVQLRKAVNDWAKWGAAASAAAATVAAAVVKSQLSSIKEIKNLADASSTSVAAFQEGAYAAEQQGISMEKYGDILLEVSRKVGEFSSLSTGPMTDFFENIAPKVGFTAEQFKKLSGKDALQLYVKSLEEANLSQDQMRFYMDAIASDSDRLLPLLKDNGKAMQEQAKRAKELGVGLADIDVAKAIAAEKALKDSSIAMDAALKKATVAISPFITEIMKQFDGSIGTVNEFAVIIGEVMSYGGKVVGIFANGIHGIRVVFAGVKMAANAMAAAVTLGFIGLIKGANDLGNALIDGIAYPIKEILKLAAPFSKVASDALVGVNKLVDGIKLKVPDAIMDFAAAQVEATAKAKAAFDKLALHQLPSESINQWVARVKEGVEKAAEETRLAVADSLFKKDEESTGTEPAENVEALRLQEETQGIIEALADRYMQEEESMIEYYARINEAIRIGEEAKTITETQAANARKQIAKDEQRFKTDTVVSTMGAIVSALSTGGKKSQEIAKKIAIAKAIVSGGQAAVDAWKAGMSTGGPYAPIVAAAYTAASLAKTGAMISSIKGGSKPSAGGSALPSVSTPAAQAPAAQAQQEPSRNISINLTGSSMFSADSVRELIEQINGQVGDGVNLVTG